MGLLEKVLNNDLDKKKNTLGYRNSLLKKAENLLSGSGEKEDSRFIEDKKKKITEQLTDFSTLILSSDSHQLTVPASIFNFLKNNFDLIKGALFFLDSGENIFLPWAISGYDNTTFNRLRFTAEDIDSLPGKTSANPFFLPKSQKKLLKKYFSSREYGLLDDLLFIPFTDKTGKIISFFLITELNSIFTTYEDLIYYTDLFRKTAGTAVGSFYLKRRSGKDSSVFLKSDSILKELEIYSSNNTLNKSFFVLFIDTESINKKIISLSPDLNSTGFNREIMGVFSALSSSSGKIYSINSNYLFIIINSPALYDKDLLLHQIHLLLNNILPGLHDSESDYINIFSYPSDIKKIKDFINA